jgi:hypothetical protein
VDNELCERARAVRKKILAALIVAFARVICRPMATSLNGETEATHTLTG